ncbi:MAG: 4Fe-4S binding protein [Methanomassiliicoccales archaeon]
MTDNGELGILNYGIPKVAKNLVVRYARIPGVHVVVRQDRCKGCGACVKKGFCRFGAISVVEKLATIDERRCRGCARCTHLCPRDAMAIEVRPHPLVKSALRHIDKSVEKLLK